MRPVTLIGVGAGQGLSPQAQQALDAAELVVGGTRQLAAFAGHTEGWDLTGRLKELAPMLCQASAAGRAVVVLASGDPMYFGVGGYLSVKLKSQGVPLKVLTAPSSVAEACARLGLKWNDAQVISLHGRPMGDVAGTLRRMGKVILLTDDKHTPARIAESLLQAGVEGQAHLVQAIGLPQERVTSCGIEGLAALEGVHPLNVLVLEVKPDLPWVPYTPDSDFEKKMPKKGLITKREVRVLSIAELGVRPGDVCWDLGAGSGAVSIDMARCGARVVHAVEKNEDGCQIIAENVRRHGTHQVQVHHSRAPAGLEALEDPDRVFIGGSGGQMQALLALVFERLRPGGAVVVNVATVENLALVLQACRQAEAELQALSVQIARSKTILKRLTRFEALNPVTIVRACAPGTPSPSPSSECP